MTIEAKIIADSAYIDLGRKDFRITTFQLKYPRFIHAEFMTHRVFSRNASSSRAIPFKKTLRDIKSDMAFPIEFKSNKVGMQAGHTLSPFKQNLCRAAWRVSGHMACAFGWLLYKLGAHKQYVNRITEPWSHISVVVTATEWNNFFALRFHSMAQPEICELARQMFVLYKNNIPDALERYEWHLPYVSNAEKLIYHRAMASSDGGKYFKNMVRGSGGFNDLSYWEPLIKRSVARCARVSYLRHDGQKPAHHQDTKLYDRLLAEQPIHASPAEHQAKPSDLVMPETEMSGNFRGWVQYRKLLPNENITEFSGPLG